MSRAARTDPPATADEDPSDQLRAALQGTLWQPAVRFAMDIDGAPERCRRRVCRKAGECRLRAVAGQPVDCGGNSSPENLAVAAGLARFAAAMVADHIEDYIFGGPFCVGLAASLGRR